MQTLLNEHPLRLELHGELHARPSLYFDGDAEIWHVALVGKDGLPSLPDDIGSNNATVRTQGGRHGTMSFAAGRLKWEYHTEFLSLTFLEKHGVGTAPPEPFLALCAGLEATIIAAVHIRVRGEEGGDAMHNFDTDYVASKVGGGDAEVRSSFRLSPSGFIEMVLINRNLNDYRTGRMVRRLLEIETYRMMALLGLPMARRTTKKITEYNDRLDLITTHMQSASKVDKALLEEVTKLSSSVLTFSAEARNRFGATRAYAELVASRIVELREDRVEQRQRLGTFIDRRFRPAIRSVEASERRLDELSQRVALAGDLLRTTVQVQLEDQNASLLQSMEARTRAQLHIQQAVEGLSVIAITYYGVGLAKACMESLTTIGLDPHMAKAAFVVIVPLVLFAVWTAVRHIRRTISVQADHS